MTQVFKYQIKTLLDSAGTGIQNKFFVSEFDSDISKYDSDEQTEFKTALRESGITVEHVDNYGGSDMGSEYWSVYEFSTGKNKVFVKFNGYYSSYDGGTFDEWFFARPVPKSGFDYVQE